MLSYLSVSKDSPWIMTGMYSTSGAVTHCLNSKVVITLSAASLQSPTMDAFLFPVGWWPCCFDIWQSRHSSGYQKKNNKKKYDSVCIIQWMSDKGTDLEMNQKQVRHPRADRDPSRNTHTHTQDQLEEGWSPTQVTQPRHNLQVSFHRCNTDWSTVKVIHTRMRWHGQRCVYTLHMTPGQSG